MTWLDEPSHDTDNRLLHEDDGAARAASPMGGLSLAALRAKSFAGSSKEALGEADRPPLAATAYAAGAIA